MDVCHDTAHAVADTADTVCLIKAVQDWIATDRSDCKLGKNKPKQQHKALQCMIRVTQLQGKNQAAALASLYLVSMEELSMVLFFYGACWALLLAGHRQGPNLQWSDGLLHGYNTK
jgi:hypothetical protein